MYHYYEDAYAVRCGAVQCGRDLTSSGVIYFFMRLKMAIRFLNWSLWLIILLRCVGGDFQVTSEFDSFENQFQRVVEPTSPGICYAWITRWQRSSFAFSSHGMVFFMSHARITRWQRSLFAFSSHGMFFFMSPNKGLLLRTRKRKWFKSRISYCSNTTASFNSVVISLLVSGDVHPHPGPEVSSQNSAQIPYSENGLSHCLNFSLLNTRSVRNKTMEVKEFVVVLM